MDDPSAADQYPTANVVPSQGPLQFLAKMRSRVWGLTVICCFLAIGLVWADLRSGGVRIQITFNDGNGIVPGDRIRFRGIDVGKVTSVVLHPDLDRVIVSVELNAESAPLAREGTRFWIERPDIRLGQVRGLETLVGGRYVGVLPGPENAPFSRTFEGLSDPPAAVENVYDGLEIVLESSQRYGLQRGSPVSFRGVEIGQVLSVGLANDSSTVVARTFIKGEYRSLVRENSRFWSNSGIDLRLGLHGLELDAETLATIAAGGVALATPTLPGERVTTGHRFELAKTPRDEWLRWQPHLAIGSASLPDDVPIPQPVLGVSRGPKSFMFLSRDQRRGWLLALDSGDLLGPKDLIAQTGDEERTLEIGGVSLSLAPDEDSTFGGLAVRPASSELADIVQQWPVARINTVSDPEKLPQELIVTCGSDNLTMPLARQRITFDSTEWKVDPQIPLDASWHGACVLSATDGMLVAILVHTDDGMRLEPLTPELLHTVEHRAP